MWLPSVKRPLIIPSFTVGRTRSLVIVFWGSTQDTHKVNDFWFLVGFSQMIKGLDRGKIKSWFFDLFLTISHFSIDLSFPIRDVMSWVSHPQILFKTLPRINLNDQMIKWIFTRRCHSFLRSNRLKNWRLSSRPQTPKSDAVERRAKSWKSCRSVTLDGKLEVSVDLKKR